MKHAIMAFLIVIMGTLSLTLSSANAHVPVKDGVRRAPRRAQTTLLTKAPFMRKITLWQRSLHKQISVLLRKQKESFSLSSLFLAISLAVLYGIIHALGPGHGKIILGSCVLGKNYKVKDILKASSLFTLVHNGSAILMYTIFILFFGALNHRTSHDITTVMYSISGVLLALMGGILFISIFIKKKEHTHVLSKRLSRISLPLASVAAGLVPCPGTLVLLLFASSLGIVWLGYVLAFSFAAGMFVTLSAVALFLATGHNFLARPLKSVIVIKILQGCGAIALILLGSYLVMLY